MTEEELKEKAIEILAYLRGCGEDEIAEWTDPDSPEHHEDHAEDLHFVIAKLRDVLDEAA